MTIDGIGQVDLVALFESRGIVLRKAASSEYKGSCPKCGGRDRFAIRWHTDRWWAFCRQCHEKRMDAVNVVEWLDGATKSEAIRTLGLHTNQPWKPKATSRKDAPAPAQHEQPPQHPPSSSWQTLVNAFVDQWHERLFAYDETSERVLLWLNERGIDGDMIREYRIGLNDTAQYLNHAKTVWAERGVMIPHYFDGGLWRVRIRRFNSDIKREQAKNPNSKPDKYRVVSGAGEDKTILFAGDELLADYKVESPTIRRVVICEGEFDAMLLRRFKRDDTAIVTMGSATITPKRGMIHLMTWTPRDVVLVMDGDSAGSSAAQKWQSAIPSARIVTPPAKDITDSWTASAELPSARDVWLASWLNGL